MKIIAINGNGFKIVLLDPEDPADFELFQHAYATLHADEQHEYDKSKKSADLEPEEEIPLSEFRGEEENLEDMFASEDEKHFLVLTAQDKPVAGSIINLNSPVPVLDNLYVLQKYRRNGLGKFLVEARLQYLAEEPEFNEAQMQIENQLAAMQNLAEKCGFKRVGKENGFQIWQRSLDDLRPRAALGNDPAP